MSDAVVVEIVEVGDFSGSVLLPRHVRINGTDVGSLAEQPKVDLGDPVNGTPATVTLVLMPSRVEIRHEPGPTNAVAAQ